jgi:hypothetical protein
MNEEPQEAPQPDFSRPPAYGQNPYPPQPPSAFERIIPAKNVKALLAYYFGVFSFIPCFTIVLGPGAMILGFLGLQECKRDVNMPGKGHAITGIVLGAITMLIWLAVVLILVMARNS